MENTATNLPRERTIARAEELMYEAVNALCHGSIHAGRQFIHLAFEIIESIAAKLDQLNDDEQALLQDLAARAVLVRADIDAEAKLLHQ